VTDPTSWLRLEPNPRDPSLADGLAARTADPLWLLARQLTFGEFTALDGGSPIGVQLTADTSVLTRLRAGGQSGTGLKLPAPGAPLEVLIEAEPEPGPRPLPATAGGPAAPRAPPAPPNAAAQAGLHYLRLLAAAPGAGNLTTYRAGLIATYPLPAAQASAPTGPPGADGGDPLLRIYAGRVPDGQALYADLTSVRTSNVLPSRPARTGANDPAIIPVALAWLDWFDAISSCPYGPAIAAATTWQPARLEYAASVAAPGPAAETVLISGQYTSGTLDWHDFDLAASALRAAPPGVSLGAAATDLPAPAAPLKLSMLPTPARYPGMPSPRFWAIEDAAVNFGDITAPTESPTTAVIVEYALCYGNDHYLIPVRLEVGTLCRVSRLIVATTFNERILIKPVSQIEPDGPFRLFEHTLPDPAVPTDVVRDPLFILFPTLDQPLTGPPIERVDYLRDEITDIVWAIEATALGADGTPVDRSSQARAAADPGSLTAPSPAEPGSIPAMRYLLRTDVEANWFPFTLPNPNDPGGNVTIMPFTEIAPSTGGTAPVPWGAIIAQQTAGLPQEEVTRAGVQAVRVWRYARAIDGTQLSWVGRQVRPGRGEGTSGLAFDLAL
jgi:hypothetical protein